jgi:hypothetical protein
MIFRALYTDLLRNGIKINSKFLSFFFNFSFDLLRSGENVELISTHGHS